MNDDIEYCDDPCPRCGKMMYYQECTAPHCDNGVIDCYEDDPINYSRGEAYEICPECHGHGRHIWCPHCGHDYLNTT